ncbi:hypothetical protein JL107_03625 [Nakamurella flavida]|uniref:Uncharacterized protein n=1 Tax=Nakamurella flavida TaxID=363630 RepID=A0A939BZA4_9ACTN|nr:hypothetical protein [Nakamurella flavida]MBM9475528.1 hypothetical protein [Nakamurella flavida]MDP9778197.1 uncharacterized membrane-anchored protein YjiN (DUF445 family) [Nakamurella flavida]
MPETEPAEEATRSLGDLLGEALQFVVFGNGYLIGVILGVFVLTVLLSRIFKGGTL